MEYQIPTLSPQNVVFIENNQVYTDSFKVAEAFNKKHFHVLRSIKKLLSDCSAGFAKSNFALCFENNELQNGKPQPYYQITKDGWMMLVMGFTGKKANLLKEAFINAFNFMYEQLNKQNQTSIQIMNELVKRETISKAKGSFGSKLMNERKKEKYRISYETELIKINFIPELF